MSPASDMADGFYVTFLMRGMAQALLRHPAKRIMRRFAYEEPARRAARNLPPSARAEVWKVINGASSLVDATFAEKHYKPHTPEAIDLFKASASQAGISADWGSSIELHNLVEHRSEGYVGRPNPQFGDIAKPENSAHWPEIWRAIQAGEWRTSLMEAFRSAPRGMQSSACGLGQLEEREVKILYPSGLAGIGNPVEESIGLLKWVERVYGTPAEAWAAEKKRLGL